MDDVSAGEVIIGVDVEITRLGDLGRRIKADHEHRQDVLCLLGHTNRNLDLMNASLQNVQGV